MNSRERLKAKRKAAGAAPSRRSADPFGLFGAARRPSHLELAEMMINEAVHARTAGDLEHFRAMLVDGPGGAVGVQAVNRALLGSLQRSVEQAWQRGWQPDELVRIVRREHTARHGLLTADAVAARMRGYPAATVDQRWREHVWWDHDDHYVTEWGAAQGLDRGAAVALVIEVLNLLARLPAIEVTGPPPGTARTATAAVPADLDQRMLDRVRALLAKAESTDFPEEAEAYTAKAQELMARHRIDHALLVAAKGERDQPAIRRVAVDNPYEAPKTLLLQVVAQANGCRAVWTKALGFTTIIGFPTDLDATELLFTSLLVQATRAMTQAESSTRSFRQSFLTAYASRIGERLSTATDEVSQEAAGSAGSAQLLPVLAARDDAVREVFEKQFPQLTHRATTVSNREGWASGRAAADRASLHGRHAVAPNRSDPAH